MAKAKYKLIRAIAAVVLQKAIMKAKIGVFVIVNFFQEFFNDTSSTTDLIEKSLSLSKTDQSSVQDQLNTDTGKQLSDTSAASDDLIFETIKQLSDYGDITELHSIIVGLSKEELPAISDLLAFALNVAQQDGASLGDALQIAFSFGRILSDSGQMSDSQLVDFTKTLQDASSAVDVLNYVAIFFRSLTDDTAVQDVAAISYQTTKNDAASFIDSITIIVAQVTDLADSAQFLDVLQFQLSLGKNEIALLTDAINSKDVSKIISEQLYGTDDFDGASSVDDDQSMDFVKSRTELGFVNESLANLVAKVAAETPSANDSGNLTTQTYASEDYFLEEYCGYIRNF